MKTSPVSLSLCTSRGLAYSRASRNGEVTQPAQLNSTQAVSELFQTHNIMSQHTCRNKWNDNRNYRQKMMEKENNFTEIKP